MTKLETLYASIKGLQDLGLPLNDETLKAADQLEEQLIKSEILPAMSKNIEPMLSQIQRDLVLVVEYHPGEPLSVALSRKTKISEIVDAVRLDKDPEVEHKEGTSPKKPATTKAPKSGIRVICRNGSVIEEPSASETMVKAIAIAGPLNVRNLNLVCCKVPLVSTTKDKKYQAQQHEVAPGLYVITYSSTETKKKTLEKISDALHLGWTVEIAR